MQEPSYKHNDTQTDSGNQVNVSTQTETICCDISTQTDVAQDVDNSHFHISSTPRKHHVTLSPISTKLLSESSSLCDSDPDYEIEHENNSSDWTSGDSFHTLPTTVSKEKKYVVFETMLEQIFMKSRCVLCDGYKTKIDKREIGTCVFFKVRCVNDHIIMDWKSQPLLGKMPAFNLLVSAAIFCSGKNVV